MSWLYLVKCPSCARFYDNTCHPCIGLCFHTICSYCKDSLKHPTCPICDRRNVFDVTVINYAATQLINDKRFQKIMTDKTDLSSGTCSECESDSDKLRVCYQCSYLKFDNFHPELSILDGKSAGICSNCAIDNHEGHSIDILSVISFGKIVEKSNVEKMLKTLITVIRSMIINCDSIESIDNSKISNRLKTCIIELIDKVLIRWPNQQTLDFYQIREFLMATVIDQLDSGEVQLIDKDVADKIDKDYILNIQNRRRRRDSEDTGVFEDLKAVTICKRLIDNFDNEYSNGFYYFTQLMADLYRESNQ